VLLGDRHPAPPDLRGRFTVAVSLILLQVADIVTTAHMAAAGGRERNPIAAWLLATDRLVEAKVLLAGFVGVLLLVAPMRRRAHQALWMVVTFYAAVVATHLAQLLGAASA
jgi:hypothetical protein